MNALEQWMIENRAPVRSGADMQQLMANYQELGGIPITHNPQNFHWSSLPSSLDTSSFYTPQQGEDGRLDLAAMDQWLQSNGYTLGESWRPGEAARWIEGPDGLLPDTLQAGSTDDSTFWNGALAAAALAGGAAYGAAGGGGMGSIAGAGEIAAPAWGSGLGAETAAGLVAPGAAGGGASLVAPGYFGGGLAAGAAGGAALAPSLSSGISAPAWGSGLGAETAAGLTAPMAAGGGGASLVAPGMAGGGGMGSGFLNALTSPSGLANLGSAALGLYGQSKALDAYGDATAQANAFNRYAFDTIRGDNKPLLDLRNSVLPQIQSLLSNPGSITSDPGYQFQFAEGQKALNNGAAARGMTYSGAQGKALQRYGQDYGATKLDQSLNRLTNVAGLGQVGANSNNAATAGFAQNASNNALGMGDARGSVYGNMANIGGNALASIFNPAQYRNLWGGP